MLTVEQLLASFVTNGVKPSENPFATKEIGVVAKSSLGSINTSTTGKFYFAVGNYRINIKAQSLTKETLTIKVLTATKVFKQMKEGDSFIIAE